MKKYLLFLIVTIFPFLGFSEDCKVASLPWLTDRAISFLDNYLREHPDAKVLEFGSGGSTVWLAQRAKSVVSIEHHDAWYSEVSKTLVNKGLMPVVKYIHHPLPYYNVVDDFEADSFDLILVDGRNRKGCLKHSLRLLKSGGILVLDDAQRPYYQEAVNLVSDWMSDASQQSTPDVYGYVQPYKVTRWFIKP